MFDPKSKAMRKITAEKDFADKIANLMDDVRFKNEKMRLTNENAKRVREARAATIIGTQSNDQMK